MDLKRKRQKRIGFMQLGLLAATIAWLVLAGVALPISDPEGNDGPMFWRFFIVFLYLFPPCIPLFYANLIMGINMLDGKFSSAISYRIQSIIKIILSFPALFWIFWFVLMLVLSRYNVIFPIIFLFAVSALILFCCALFVFEMRYVKSFCTTHSRPSS